MGEGVACDGVGATAGAGAAAGAAVVLCAAMGTYVAVGEKGLYPGAGPGWNAGTSVEALMASFDISLSRSQRENRGLLEKLLLL